MPNQEHDVQLNEAESRFEVISGSQVSKLDYRLIGQKIALVHTEVPEDLSGQGIGSALVATALEYARSKELTILPYCPFVASYIKRHPEWQAYVGTLE